MIRLSGTTTGGIRFLLVAIAMLAMAFSGCSSDSPTGPTGNTGAETGVVRGGVDPGEVVFEYISATNGDPGNPVDGPFAIRGRNIRYEGEALIVDLSVANLGESTYPEPVSLTFLSLMPDGVTVKDPDNDENGAGARIDFEFENDDAMWAPGEESMGRSTSFMVAEGTAIAFVARIDAGSGDDQKGSIGGMVWNDANGDGIMDPDESAAEGVAIELSAEGMDKMSTSSGSDGSYRFDGLEAGFYTVDKVARDGVIATTPSTLYVTLVEFEGQVGSFLAANFGCMMKDGGGDGFATIGGLVYDDLNVNGMWDEGEPGIGEVRVKLSSRKKRGHEGATRSPDEHRYAWSDEDGTYIFEEVLAGTWRVEAKKPMLDKDYHRSSSKKLDFTVEAGDVVDDAHFGFYVKDHDDDDCDDDDDHDDDDDDDDDDEDDDSSGALIGDRESSGR